MVLNRLQRNVSVVTLGDDLGIHITGPYYDVYETLSSYVVVDPGSEFASA
jgi:hypothetical protein